MDATTDRRQQRILILGAAGRDFHQFNTQYRDNPEVQVIGFTATQVWYISCMSMPDISRTITERHCNAWFALNYSSTTDPQH